MDRYPVTWHENNNNNNNNNNNKYAVLDKRGLRENNLCCFKQLLTSLKEITVLTLYVLTAAKTAMLLCLSRN
jgi:hypothetical protein